MFDYCTCFSHWVYFAGDHGSLFKTEYAGEFVRFSLSMQRNSSFTYRVCRGIGHIHTEYAEEFVRFIQSMRKSEMVRVKLNLSVKRMLMLLQKNPPNSFVETSRKVPALIHPGQYIPKTRMFQ